MTGSALYGQPPNDQKDYMIIQGLLVSYGFPESTDPARGLPTRQHAPPNYRFETRGPGVIEGLVVALVLSFLITGTRLLLRAGRKDLRWGLDDWVIIPAGLGTMGWMGCQIAMVTHGGIGKHIWDVSYVELYWFFRLAAISEVLFYLTVGMIKISITLFNRRLTGLTSRRWMIAHYTFLFLLVCYILAALFLELFKCNPPTSHFSMIRYGQVGEGCMDWIALGIGLSVVHVIFDFALLSVPLIILYKVKMNRAKKIRLGLLFSVGSMSCIASAMRHHVQIKALGRPDLTWTFPTRAPWTLADMFFALVAASLPVLNAAIPKRWRSKPSSPRNPYPVSAVPFGIGNPGGSLRSELDGELPDQNRYLGLSSGRNTQDNEHSDRFWTDSLHSPQQLTPWIDLGHLEHGVTYPAPTYRERISASGHQGD